MTAKNIQETAPADDVFTSEEFSMPTDPFRIPQETHHSEPVYQLIHDELMADGNARLNLATFCSTYEPVPILKLMREGIHKNLIDKDEYPQTAEIERRCIQMIADLWHVPKCSHITGTSTSGSSEAAMLGGMAMKWKWRQRMKERKKNFHHPNLVTGPVQVCWHKFAKYWDIELREITMEGNRYFSSPEEVILRCDENTIGVVQTLGTTFTLNYEPILDVARALDHLESEKGWDIPIHVDAASGGFLAPFMTPELVWDFQIPRVCSINASGHKFGLAPLGVGWILWRDETALPNDLVFHINYLGGEMPSFTLNFSKPGGQVISQYYLFLWLGKDGFRNIQKTCYDTAAFMAEEIKKWDMFEIVSCSSHGIPGVCWKIKENSLPGFNLYDFSDRLRFHGWMVPAYSLPKNCTQTVIQRAVIRHGVTLDLIKLLLRDMQDTLDYFHLHPVLESNTRRKTTGFLH